MVAQLPSKKIGEREFLLRFAPHPCLTAVHSPLADRLLLTGVLGATGSVGQRFILLLQNHPSFVLHAVGASSRSAGKKYRDAVRWKQASPMGAVGDLVVRECKSSEFADCDIIFSGLDSDVAGDVGMFGGTLWSPPLGLLFTPIPIPWVWHPVLPA